MTPRRALTILETVLAAALLAAAAAALLTLSQTALRIGKEASGSDESARAVESEVLFDALLAEAGEPRLADRREEADLTVADEAIKALRLLIRGDGEDAVVTLPETDAAAPALTFNVAVLRAERRDPSANQTDQDAEHAAGSSPGRLWLHVVLSRDGEADREFFRCVRRPASGTPNEPASDRLPRGAST